MSSADGRERKPWWYSGGDEEPPTASPEEAAAPPAMDAAQPSVVDPGPSERDDAPTTPGGMDWSTLVAGAQRMVDWATEKVMAPHAEHDDPAQHPQCMVCRTIVLVGDQRGLSGRVAEPVVDGSAGTPEPSGDGPQAIRWIPIREDVTPLDDGPRN